MSRVVLYRVIAPTGVATICAKNVAENSYESLPLSGVCIAGELAHASPWIVEPVEYVPASVAMGLVEALTVCVENLETYLDQEGCVVGGMQPIKKAKAALAAAEEELK